MKIFYKKGVGKKSGKKYHALVIDFGYRKEFLMDLPVNLIAEMLGRSVRDLDKIEVGEYEIGEIKEDVQLTQPAADDKKGVK